MTTGTEYVPPPTPSAGECYAHCARVLHHAEGETDRELMSRYDDIARTWLMLGSQIDEREREGSYG